MRHTNVLALPLVHLIVETGSNEDWSDNITYLTLDGEPVDLRGIEFDMQLRRRPDDYDVVLYATSANQMLSIGDAPSWNKLIIHVPLVRMQRTIFPGEYIADIVAHDEVYHRVCFTMDVRVIHGVTRP